jgi:hypothetical protein
MRGEINKEGLLISTVARGINVSETKSRVVRKAQEVEREDVLVLRGARAGEQTLVPGSDQPPGSANRVNRPIARGCAKQRL